MTTLYVAPAGVLGVLTRYGIGRAVAGTDRAIWTTVGINVVGSFLLGVLVAGHWAGREVRDAVGVGFLGGFTTFSTFSVHIVQEVDGGHPGAAPAYVIASVGGGIAAAAAGVVLARSWG